MLCKIQVLDEGLISPHMFKAEYFQYVFLNGEICGFVHSARGIIYTPRPVLAIRTYLSWSLQSGYWECPVFNKFRRLLEAELSKFTNRLCVWLS